MGPSTAAAFTAALPGGLTSFTGAPLPAAATRSRTAAATPAGAASRRFPRSAATAADPPGGAAAAVSAAAAVASTVTAAGGRAGPAAAPPANGAAAEGATAAAAAAASPPSAPTSTPLRGAPPVPPLPSDVLYFAYGANMSPRSYGPLAASPLRRLPLVAASVGVAPDWAVAFNVPGVGPTERAFANLVPRPRHPRRPLRTPGRGEPAVGAGVGGSPTSSPPAAMGVVYRMRAADWSRLKVSEGSGLPGGATQVTVEVQVPAAGSDGGDDAAAAAPPVTLRVRSLVWPAGQGFPARPLLPAWAASVMRPSERYLRLLRDGAAVWGIPAHYAAAVYGEGSSPSLAMPAMPSFRPPPPRPSLTEITSAGATRSRQAEARRRDRRSPRPPPRQALPAVAASLDAVPLTRRGAGGAADAAAAAGGVDFGLLFSPWRRVGDGPGGGAELVQGKDFTKGVDLRIMAPAGRGRGGGDAKLEKRLLVFLPGIDGTGMRYVDGGA